MGDVRLRGGDGRDLAPSEMNAMSEHSFRREQSVLLVDVGVIPSAHVKVVYLLDFFAVFGKVRLQISVEARRHFRGTAHQFFRAGDGKSRTESVFEASIFGAVPFTAEPFALHQ